MNMTQNSQKRMKKSNKTFAALLWLAATACSPQNKPIKREKHSFGDLEHEWCLVNYELPKGHKELNLFLEKYFKYYHERFLNEVAHDKYGYYFEFPLNASVTLDTMVVQDKTTYLVYYHDVENYTPFKKYIRYYHILVYDEGGNMAMKRNPKENDVYFRENYQPSHKKGISSDRLLELVNEQIEEEDCKIGEDYKNSFRVLNLGNGKLLVYGFEWMKRKSKKCERYGMPEKFLIDYKE